VLTAAVDRLKVTSPRLDQDEFQLTSVGSRAVRKQYHEDDSDWPLRAGERHTTEYNVGRTRTRAQSGPTDEVVEQTEEATLGVFDS
jgi:hypothetical protein